MHAHQRQEHTRLNPAQHAFDVGGIVVLIARTEEAAGIVGPPRHTRCLHSQSGHNLPAESLPVVAHVATPQGGAIALYTREAAASKNHRLTTCSHQSFIDRLVHQQRIHVAHQFARPAASVHAPSSQVVVFRLRGILPPRIDAQRHEPLVEVPPIGRCSSGIEEVYPVGTRNIIVGRQHFATHLRILINLRPNAQHQLDSHLMKAVGEQLRVGIVVFVEAHGIPAILAPPLPVLHQHAHGQLFLLEAVGSLEDFLR